MDGVPESAAGSRRTSEQVVTRSFLAKSTWRKTRESGVNEDKGPLGLTTVYTPLKDAIGDFIFIHGLGGGSQKTWTKNGDPSLFWPKEWLPQDSEFRDVRIHTFGYDSDWGKESILNIHDFAKSLLEWINNSPDIPKETDTPVIFVCHSMGGLVAKQAYVLSRRLPEYEKISTLLRSMVFLATPHRGSDLAETLSRLLAISPGARPFVVDLHPSSKSIQSINEEFPRYAGSLQLHSFYETQPMSFGLKKGLVVERESAVLGYDNERSTYLNADHRTICKFDSPNSSNYRAVRNALATSFNLVRTAFRSKAEAPSPRKQQAINSALDVEDRPEDDYLRAESLKIRGSCEWISRREKFQTWSKGSGSQIYWVTAKPGAGKSILCAHVLKLLRDGGHKCSFFFFTNGDKSKSSLSGFFRSVAWQLASNNSDIFEHMAEICARDPQLMLADHRTIWRKLFIECVFKHKPREHHCWVIDAVDECKHDQELVYYLMQAAANGYSRIFLTSRTIFDSYGITRNPKSEVHVDAISEETTNADIELFIKANMEYLPTRDHASTAELVLEKSDGCFLWTKLALQELKQGLTRSGIKKILEEVPADMDTLYERIIGSMFEKAREERMITAILQWTLWATRPLTTEELHQALRLDMEDEIDGDIKRFIETNCGQLVVVDTSNHVRMVHLTAGEFLMSPRNTTHRFDKSDGHRRLAMTCLKYLKGPDLAGGRHRKLSATHIHTEQETFIDYAATALFEHINFVRSEDDDFATILTSFMKSPNVLYWIEHIARHSDLGRLVQAGLALRKYSARRDTKTLPFGRASQENALLDRWATDLVRLVTKFGHYIHTSPAVILHHVAPFCPADSAIRLQFGSSNRAIKVNGSHTTSWDDCVSTIRVEESLSAIAATSDLFAMGFQNGSIRIYDENTCQQTKSLVHGEAVKKLLFAMERPIFVVGGLNTITLWDTDSWLQLHSLDLETQFISLAFTDEDRLLMATCRSNNMLLWDTETGHQHPPESWLEEENDAHAHLFRRPSTTAIAADQTLLALAYRGEDITIWDIEQGTTYDVYGKGEGSRGSTAAPRQGVSTARSMIFSKALDFKLLVVSYNDGIMNLFNMEQGTLQAHAPANAHTLASSSDGLTLACGDSGGLIQLFEFETLKLLYRIQADETTIKQLAFSGDDHRLLGIQSRHCYVWDPPVLVRQTLDEENSDTVSISTGPQEFHVIDRTRALAITSMSLIGSGVYVICGKEDGSIYLYNSKLGRQEAELLAQTQNVLISHIEVDSVALIMASADVSSRVMVHKLETNDELGFQRGPCLLDIHVETTVVQIVLQLGGQRLLISTEKADLLFSLQPDSATTNRPPIARQPSLPGRKHHRWSTHPLKPEILVLTTSGTAHLFEWLTLKPLTTSTGILMASETTPDMSVTYIRSCFNESHLATTYAESANPYARSRHLFWDTSALTPSSPILQPDTRYEFLSNQVHHLIGNVGTGTTHQRLIFLHRDGWICSASASSIGPPYVERHFFLPSDWLSGLTRLRIAILPNDGTLLFVRHAELISVSRGLEYFEDGQSSRMSGKRPSLRGGTAAGGLSEESMEGLGEPADEDETSPPPAGRRKRGGVLAERLRVARMKS